VSNVEQCEAVVNGARERFGSVDVLVNNAGVGAREAQSTAAACGDFA
jgi:NAD(P)-dependent dehydrogenase (short-subunit alcohol dehydrogenase family)